MVRSQLDRITQQPEVMGGRACIRGTRVTVGMLVGQIGAGHNVDEVLADYPYIERADIMQALQYAAWRSEERDRQQNHGPYAAAHGCVVLTHHLDFGSILAVTHGEKPSVVQIRATDVSPDVIDRQVIIALVQMAAELEEGALLTVDPNRPRLSMRASMKCHC